MAQILCLRLFGPQASWGTARAGTVSRPSARHPTRGAILGLAAAALGLERGDTAAQSRLSGGLSVASASYGPRRIFTDLHTVQSVAEQGSRAPIQYVSRAHALAHAAKALPKSKIASSLFEMQIVEDGLWTIFYTTRDGSSVDLTELAHAFKNPKFELYLGRREFPLSLPADPCLHMGALQDVVNQYGPLPQALPRVSSGAQKASKEERDALYHERLAWSSMTESVSKRILKKSDFKYDLHWDADFPETPTSQRTTFPRDTPASRTHWTFLTRQQEQADCRIPDPETLVDTFFHA